MVAVSVVDEAEPVLEAVELPEVVPEVPVVAVSEDIVVVIELLVPVAELVELLVEVLEDTDVEELVVLPSPHTVELQRYAPI